MHRMAKFPLGGKEVSLPVPYLKRSRSIQENITEKEPWTKEMEKRRCFKLINPPLLDSWNSGVKMFSRAKRGRGGEGDWAGAERGGVSRITGGSDARLRSSRE